MGTVYLATRQGQVAAVKVISPGLANEPGFRARFRREVELCGRVSAPNVARVLGADADGPTAWLAMQYVEGPTLHQRVLADGPLPTGEVERLAGGLALALQAMHRVGVVHRDLKPSNVILTSNGPVVIDFGVATAAEATSLTATGTVVGSAGWMAPEQVQGAAVGPPTDVFSWGATVAFAATGRPPFGTGRPEAVAYRVVHESPDLGGFAGPLGGLVRRSMHANPAGRPTVADLLTSPQEQTTAVAASSPSPDTTQVEPTTTFTQVAEPGVDRRLSGRGRQALVLVAIAAAALLAAAVGMWTRTTSDEADTLALETGSTSTTAIAEPTSTTSPASSSSAPTTSATVATAEETNVVATDGATPPPLPASLQGWAPLGPMERTEVRVFDTETYSIGPEIGPSFNSCSDGFWTARWRSANDAVPVRVAVGYSALVDPSSPEWTNEPLPPDSPTGAAGYASGFICQTPQFGWSGDGGTGSTLVDVIIEWQAWEPAV
jgi:serine/threonine protein kinase